MKLSKSTEKLLNYGFSKGYVFPKIGFLILFFFIFSICLLNINRIETDNFSEHNCINDAKEIIKGNQSFGIVNYTHYPIGTSYILLPVFAISLDVGINSLRIIPIFFFSVIFCLFVYRLFQFSRRKLDIWVIGIVVIGLLFQPGIILWSGALHEHSYVMTLVFLICFSGLSKSFRPVFYLLIGFIGGWFGYDFIFVHLSSMFSIRFIFYNVINKKSFTYSLITSFRETLFGVGGYIIAIILHLGQNILFYKSFSVAFNDLFGSAYVRASLDKIGNANPNYLSYIRDSYETHQIGATNNNNYLKDIVTFFDSVGLEKSRLLIIILMTGYFVIGFSNPIILLGTSLTLVLVGLYITKKKRRFLFSFFLFFIFNYIAAISWLILMKYHALFHFHFLPRLFFPLFILSFVYLYFIIQKSEHPIHKKSIIKDCPNIVNAE